MKKLLLFLSVMLLAASFLISCGAEPDPVTYTVKFDTNGGEKIDSVSVVAGGTVADPGEPEKDYENFLGWYLGNEKYDFDTPVNSDITIKAKWEKIEYKVKFDTDGGSIIDRVKVYGGETVEKPADPTKADCVFVGWFVDGEEYDFDTPVDSDLTIKAEWKPVEYTVKFDTDGGSSVASQTIVVSNTVTVPDDPTKEGYIFLGWYYGNSKYDFTTSVKGDMTIKAKWRYIVPDDTKVYTKKQSVLLIGQSNMVGAGVLTKVEPISDDRITVLRDGGWEKLVEPVHEKGQTCLAASFAKAFVETFDCELGLIPAAVSGTNLNPNGNTPWEDTWAVGSPLYEEAMRLAKIAQMDSEICAILWHQGEGDQNNKRYAEMLQPIFDAMIEELGLDPNKIVIITGELFGTRSDAVHGPQLELLGEHYENYGIAQSDGLTVYDVTTHFDGPSLRVFGYRYFAIFYNLVTGKEYTFIDDPLHYLKE